MIPLYFLYVKCTCAIQVLRFPSMLVLAKMYWGGMGWGSVK
jgi:hypothetical protein